MLEDHYGFSPRLAGLMRTPPDKPHPSPAIAGTNAGRLHKILHSQAESFKSVDSQSNDIEMTNDTHKQDPGMIDLNHYRITNNVWHFFSVDWGSKCKMWLCL